QWRQGPLHVVALVPGLVGAHRGGTRIRSGVGRDRVPLLLDLGGLAPRVTRSILAMFGECTGKVRSTPTPNEILRTVKVSRMPPFWRRITTPWNTWTRSREPSMTRTWTFRLSPGRKSGMSERSD